jgi:hypothetical protein
MDSYDRYKYLLGETILLYQMMENDLKLIYAGMQEGNFFKNIENVRGTYKGLGQIILALEELDTTRSSPYFTKDTYTLLNKLARQRNYYCHQCSLDFCYDPYFRESIEFKDALSQLERTNEIIKSVQAQTSGHRANVLTRYNRV